MADFAYLSLLLFFGVSILLIVYAYPAFALMTIARKTKTKKPWLAWIPLANFYLMVKIARFPGWWVLFFFASIIPVIGTFVAMAFGAYTWWYIAERRKMPGWYGLLVIVPIANLVIMGIIAWGKKSGR